MRYEPDGGLHVEGDGETAWGVKFVLVAAAPPTPTDACILDVDWVPKAGGEARTAIGAFTRLAPHIDGAQGVVYDTALRGVHHQTLLRGSRTPPHQPRHRRQSQPQDPPPTAERRVEKSAYIEGKTITLDGRDHTLRALRTRRRRRHR